MSMEREESPLSPDLSARTEPPGADGVVGRAPSPGGDGEEIEAGVDEFVDNTRAILKQSGHVLIFAWVAIVLVMSFPVLWKITQGYDPLQPFAFDLGVATLLIELGCQALAIALFTMSLPVGRAYLLGEGPGPRTFGEAWEVAARHLDDAVLIAVLYYVAIIGGFMMCVIPGLIAAVYLAPALYLAAARGEPTIRALLKGSAQLGRHSNLYVFIVVGLGVVFFGTALALGLAIDKVGGFDELAAAAADPLSMVLFIGGYIAVATLLFFLYIATLGVFTTIEAAETGQAVDRSIE